LGKNKKPQAFARGESETLLSKVFGDIAVQEMN